MNKTYKFKGQTFNITGELAKDIGVYEIESPIFFNEELKKIKNFGDVVFRHCGIDDDGTLKIRVYEIEEGEKNA